MGTSERGPRRGALSGLETFAGGEAAEAELPVARGAASVLDAEPA